MLYFLLFNSRCVSCIAAFIAWLEAQLFGSPERADSWGLPSNSVHNTNSNLSEEEWRLTFRFQLFFVFVFFNLTIEHCPTRNLQQPTSIKLREPLSFLTRWIIFRMVFYFLKTKKIWLVLFSVRRINKNINTNTN